MKDKIYEVLTIESLTQYVRDQGTNFTAEEIAEAVAECYEKEPIIPLSWGIDTLRANRWAKHVEILEKMTDEEKAKATGQMKTYPKFHAMVKQLFKGERNV